MSLAPHGVSAQHQTSINKRGKARMGMDIPTLVRIDVSADNGGRFAHAANYGLLLVKAIQQSAAREREVGDVMTGGRGQGVVCGRGFLRAD